MSGMQKDRSTACSLRSVPCEIDMEAVPVPLTRERALGLQHELRERIGAGDFQARLCECERVHGRGTPEFRRWHQQLVLEAQAAVLPKYGFDGSLGGVADMLAALKVFSGDSEVAANTRDIEALIWEPHEVHRPLHQTECPNQGNAQEAVVQEAVLPRAAGNWQSARRGVGAIRAMDSVLDTVRGRQTEDLYDADWSAAGAQESLGLGPHAPQDDMHIFASRAVPCEIDLNDVSVPLMRERALGLQHELLERLGTSDFQARLRDCELTHGDGTLEFRRQHQQLVLDVQATVLPKYGFDGSLEGVTDMLTAFKAFSDDPEISANITAIDALIWRSGAPVAVGDTPQKREA